MQYRKSGKIESNTSILGFGCMRLPLNAEGKIDRKEALKMMDYAYDRGINYYDTAYGYHFMESEEVVGEWVKTKERNTFYLATKSPVWLYEDLEGFWKIFHEQQSKLQTDYFDFYLMHALDKERFEKLKKLNIKDVLDELKAKGLVKRIGFSFHDSYEVFEEIIHYYDWDFCQIQLNYMDEYHQAGVKGYELAKSLNIPVVIMEPIKGGALSAVPTEIREAFDTVHPEWSDSSWALRWVANFDNVFCILSGMNTMDQVKDNILTFETFESLTQNELKIIKEAGELFRSRTKVSCTGCEYCLPCTNGVNIPKNFKCYNHAHIYESFARNKDEYNWLEETEKANHCIACGVCLEKCPQKINIIEELKHVANYFKGE